jgi:hypothetical protein
MVALALTAVGGVAVAGGLSAVGVGVAPAILYLVGARDQAAAAQRYGQADTVAEQRQAAGAAADAYADQAQRAYTWNQQGRWLAIGGAVGVGVGVGLLLGGLFSFGDNDNDDDTTQKDDT